MARRTVLKTLAGAAGVATAPWLLEACGNAASPTSSATVGGTVTVGSNHSDANELKGMQNVLQAFTQSTGVQTTLNTVDHGTFQDQITSYLQGTPQDVFSWFSGHRMRFFASKGLATPLDDVWNKVKGNYTSAFATSVKGDDGHVYGVPTDYYPWAIFYRKSVFQAHNYTIPTTWDQFKALCAQMQKDGLTPIAFADKDGWPAMGTFDILNLRLNGYDFHVGLCTGKQKWTDPRVTKVFQTWSEITSYYSTGFAGMTWQQAADQLIQKKAGMYLLGLFVSGEFVTTGVQADLADLDFFPFPNLGTQYDAEKALDAPIDIWMISKKSPNLSKDLANAKAYLEFWAKGSTQLIFFQQQPGAIPTANDADQSSYTALTKKAAQLVSQAQKITQFFDRDSRPDFAGANGMQSFLLKYLANPKQDTTTLQGQMQQFWDSLPPES